MNTAWKLSIFGGFLLCIFRYSGRIRENTDQKNFDYGHFHKVESLHLPIKFWLTDLGDVSCCWSCRLQIKQINDTSENELQEKRIVISFLTKWKHFILFDLFFLFIIVSRKLDCINIKLWQDITTKCKISHLRDLWKNAVLEISENSQKSYSASFIKILRPSTFY